MVYTNSKKKYQTSHQMSQPGIIRTNQVCSHFLEKLIQ